MEESQWNTYQYRKNGQYAVYLRLRQDDLNAKFNHLFQEMGFTLLTEAEVKKIKLSQPYLKILTIRKASQGYMQLIQSSDILDEFGQESMGLYSNVPTYTFRRVGIMLIPKGKTLWELDINPEISHTEQMVGFRIMLVRFLSLALADQGVLSYWGTVKDGTIIIMKQAQSFGEAVFIDMKKKFIFSNGGEMQFDSSLKIVRKDKIVLTTFNLTREDLISFLSVSTCLLSFTGITQSMKKNIFELSFSSTASYGLSENDMNL
jgi:hypothetical protein